MSEPSRPQHVRSVEQPIPRNDPPAVTAWVGWVWFAGIMLVTVGFFDILQGIIALVDDDFRVAVQNGLLVFDLTTWGWWHIIAGAILVIAGAGVLAGAIWGRVLGVIVAVLNLLAQLTIMPAYPFWALIVVALNVVVIYALVVHGAEAKADDSYYQDTR